ncbi:nectin-4-like isoform X2 [Salarias fasciatus]|uniref:nectin-4-like isoform X2 n=1 Tax=Salarias fasciatus TaxID=181472 RepID=UPI001176870D|nr:nectin-4-like isoform X2 [Salarias fasciatus]
MQSADADVGALLERKYKSDVVLPGVSVTGGDLTVVEGHDVTLPCKMTEQEKTLTQISWRRKTRGMPGNPFFYTISEENGQSFVNDPDPRISFIGNFAERDGTLQISNVSLNDEGSYTCIFSLFPSGTYSTEIPLRVEVPPATSLNSTLLVLGNEEVLLATCTAAASRPAAQLRWIIGALGKNLRETTSVTEHDNGTTTTVSSLFGVPRREISGHEVQCVVSSSALAEEHREAFTLQVFFPPMNVTIVETSDDTLECVSEGNPEPSVRWTRSDKTLPESDFRVDGGKLTFLRCASDLKGFYQCEVSNPYGQQSQQVYWTVVSVSNPLPWILLVLVLIPYVIIAVRFFYKSGYIARFWRQLPTGCSRTTAPSAVRLLQNCVPESFKGFRLISTQQKWYQTVGEEGTLPPNDCSSSGNGHTPMVAVSG